MRSVVTARGEVSITRLFNAPKALLWEVWTRAEHISKWLGLQHHAIPPCEWEAKVGGKVLLHVRLPDGLVLQMKGRFEEVDATDRLVLFIAAADSDGRPMVESIAVDFVEKGHQTEISLNVSAVGYGDVAEVAIGSMQSGWSYSIEKLADHIQALGVSHQVTNN